MADICRRCTLVLYRTCANWPPDSSGSVHSPCRCNHGSYICDVPIVDPLTKLNPIIGAAPLPVPPPGMLEVPVAPAPIGQVQLVVPAPVAPQPAILAVAVSLFSAPNSTTPGVLDVPVTVISLQCAKQLSPLAQLQTISYPLALFPGDPDPEGLVAAARNGELRKFDLTCIKVAVLDLTPTPTPSVSPVASVTGRPTATLSPNVTIAGSPSPSASAIRGGRFEYLRRPSA